MANTKYLNQIELSSTFTPNNAAIAASDNGQVVAEKTQGQINAISPPALPLSIANGGTGQATQQLALNALAGAVTTKYYLRGDNTNVSMSAIQAGDVPTLNQNTSGTASNVTGIVALANGGTNANLTASNGGIFYSSATAGAILAGTATAGQVLRSGASTTPAWSTATYPATTTINRILYSSAVNVVDEITTGNNGTLITSAGGVPSISSTLPSTVQGNITATGALASGSLAAGFTAVTVPIGGTGVATTTAYGVLCGGTTATGAFQNAGAGTATQVLTSNGAAALPSWAAPSAGSLTSYSAATGAVGLLSNTTNWQNVTGATVTLPAGTYLITYVCGVNVHANASGGNCLSYTRIYNSTDAAILANTQSVALNIYQSQNPTYMAACGAATVVSVLAAQKVLQVQASISYTTNMDTFGTQNTTITALKIG